MGLRKTARNWLFALQAGRNNVRDDSAEIDELRRTIKAQDQFRKAIDLIMTVSPSAFVSLYPQLSRSQSQNMQDVFVLAKTNLKRNGFFVEFGATNGLELSNTYLLEKQYDWTGILAEPAKIWSEALHKNRNCFIDVSCVWSESGKLLPFQETAIAELSTVSQFGENDFNAQERVNRKVYDVTTISLNDLLAKYNAPRAMDFLSIDTEGSEYEIMSTFDFDKYSFEIIVCEHNYTPLREKIFDLLTSRGYERIYEQFSGWDDWFVRRI